MQADPLAGRAPSRLRLLRVRVPLVQAHRSARSVEAVRDVVLVEWTRADGVVGWGECPTLGGDGYVTGSTERAWMLLVTELGPATVGGSTAIVAGAMAAVGALADARLDAELRAGGRRLSDLLEVRRTSVPRAVVLADVGGDLDQLARRAEAAVRAGARLVKVKVAPGHDVAPVAAVRAVVGEVPVAADANGSYTDAEALAELDGLGLAYLEQPFAPGATWDELAARHQELRTPVALDESLTSPDAVVAALRAGALDVVSVKPSRLGGIVAAASVVRAAEASGVAAFVGGMLELGIGRAGAATVAAMSGCTLPTDLGPSASYVAEDVCEPLVLDELGDLRIPAGEGLGRQPDPARLDAVVVDEVVLGR